MRRVRMPAVPSRAYQRARGWPCARAHAYTPRPPGPARNQARQAAGLADTAPHSPAAARRRSGSSAAPRICRGAPGQRMRGPAAGGALGTRRAGRRRMPLGPPLRRAGQTASPRRSPRTQAPRLCPRPSLLPRSKPPTHPPSSRTVFASLSAPAARSSRTASTWPCSAARCRAVRPCGARRRVGVTRWGRAVEGGGGSRREHVLRCALNDGGGGAADGGDRGAHPPHPVASRARRSGARARHDAGRRAAANRARGRQDACGVHRRALPRPGTRGAERGEGGVTYVLPMRRRGRRRR